MTTFSFEVDWDQDGSYTDETAYCRFVRCWAGFEKPGDRVAAPGGLVARLDNSTRRFSPGNSGGALYGDLGPGRAVRVRAASGAFTWTLWSGWITALEPNAGEWGSGECLVEASDGMRRLWDAAVSVAYAETKDVDLGVDTVVDAAYTPGATDYDNNGDVLDDFGIEWKPEVTRAAEALGDICGAVYGRFWVARDGTAVFWSRTQEQDGTGSAALDLDLATDAVGGLRLGVRQSAVVTRAEVVAYPRETVGALQVIWTARTTLRIAPGETREVYALFRDDNGERCGAVDVVEPVATTDYRVFEFADGSGVEYTSEGSFSISFETDATRMKITLGNTALGPLYVTFLQVRGKPVRVYDPVSVEEVDAAAELEYGERGVVVDARMLSSEVLALAYAQYLVGRFGAAVLGAEELVSTLDTLGGVNVFSLGIYDRVLVTDGESGMSDVGHVVRRVEYELEGGRTVVRLGLERSEQRLFVMLDEVGLAELDGGAGLGF